MRHATAFVLVWVCGATALVAVGCAPTVGTRANDCDDDLAREVVYRLDGTPAYIGQAMLIQSCASGGSFCHAEGAADRYGVPFGLDFDAALADSDAASLLRLARIQNTIHRNRNAIYAQVVGGAMPPGAVGDMLDTDLYYYIPDPAVVPMPLESIDSAAGRERLRNWLACGAPVIERTAPLASPVRCTTNAECEVTNLCDLGVRECVGVGDVVPVLDLVFDPVWPVIYQRVIEPSCASAIGCHGPEPRSAGLDMSTAANGYASLVGAAASTDVPSGALCGDMGLTRVVPGDPDASLLMLKLDGLQPCGSPMPFGPPITDNALSAIREWITLGAMP